MRKNRISIAGRGGVRWYSARGLTAGSRPDWAQAMTPDEYEALVQELDRLSRPERQGLDVDLARRLRARIVDGWQQVAACASADPEAWFPEQMGSAVKPAVVRTCAACPVRRSCLASALLWTVEGIWAGTTPTERRHLLARLRAGEPVNEILTHALIAAADRKPGPRRNWLRSGSDFRTGIVGGSSATEHAG